MILFFADSNYTRVAPPPASMITAFLAVFAATATVLAPVTASAEKLADVFSARAVGSNLKVDHTPWDRLLSAYVVAGRDGINRVAYASFKRQGQIALRAYLDVLQKVEVARLDRAEQFAFWANLYNAKTIDIVLDKYPVISIKNINLGGGLFTIVTGGPWKAKVVNVAGRKLSLDDIEHGILRPVFKDPRVHYAVNCASNGCPNLMRQAFTGTKLEAQLDAGARAYINHPRAIRVTAGKITASSIYSWFEADFGGGQAGVLRHIRRYAQAALLSKLKGVTAIDEFAYDWSLNDARG